MSEMIERVTKAIAAADGQGEYAVARAAIEAMREPTYKQRRAGEDVELCVDFDEAGRSVGFAAQNVWRAMIDAALNSGKPLTAHGTTDEQG